MIMRCIQFGVVATGRLDLVAKIDEIVCMSTGLGGHHIWILVFCDKKPTVSAV